MNSFRLTFLDQSTVQGELGETFLRWQRLRILRILQADGETVGLGVMRCYSAFRPGRAANSVKGLHSIDFSV